jgi:hypothetical protein
MWTRDDIHRAAEDAKERAVQGQCLSKDVLQKVMLDVAVRMALDNAATVAERFGDPEIESAIKDLKDQFPES